MSEKTAVVSRRVLRSVSLTDVKEQSTSSVVKDDSLQNRIEELEKFILSLNLDSALIEPLKIKQKVGSKRGRKKVEQKNTLTEDEQDQIDVEELKSTKRVVRNSTRKGVATKSASADIGNSANNENNDEVSANLNADSSTEEVVSSGVVKSSSSNGTTKRGRTTNSKSPLNSASISPLPVLRNSSVNSGTKKEDSTAATSVVPFANPDSIETLNSILDQPTDKQMRKMPNFLAARLNSKGPTAATSASAVAARKAAAAAAAPSMPVNNIRIPSAPRPGRDLSTGRSKTEASSVTFSASTKRPAPSVTSHRSSSAERKSISGGVLKSATKRPLSSKVMFDWKAAALAIASHKVKDSSDASSAEKTTTSGEEEEMVVLSAEEIAPALCLFIAHDNPQLSKTVTSRLSAVISSIPPPPPTASPKDVSRIEGSRGTGMQIMLESKGKGDQTHFLIGDIIYSGDYAHVQDTATSNVRGSEWLIVTNLRAVRHAVKQFVTRSSETNKEVVEINLVDVPAASVADVSTAEGVVEFLSACQARVDCILDPYHSDNTWYPYFEGTASGGAQRKMAPQFRSQGIGYIRLGDDMSNFGVAFVSLDAGATYLDNGATSIVDSNLAAKTKFVATPSGKAIRSKSALVSRRSLSTDPPEDYLGAATPSAALANSRKSVGAAMKRVVTGTSKQTSMEKVLDLLSSLQDATIKFSQRTEHLNALQSLLSDIYLKTSRADILEVFVLKNVEGLGEVIRVLLEYLAKQKHPLVVAATLQCIGTLTYGELLATHYAVSWRALMVETAHMLRNNNKQIFEAVMGALGSLYRSRSLSFAYLSGGGGSVLLDILNGPRSSGGVSLSSSAALVVSGGSNIAKVVTWLDSMAKSDLEAAGRLCAVQTRTISNDEVVESQRRADREASQLNLIEALRRCSFLLSHREEITREHGISLVVHYLALFLLLGHFSQESLAQVVSLSTLDAKSISGESADMLAALEALEKLSARSYEKMLLGVVQTVSRVAGDLSAILAEAPAAAVTVSTSSAAESVVAADAAEPVVSENDSSDELVTSDDGPQNSGTDTDAHQVPTTPIVDNSESVMAPVDFQSPVQDGGGVAPLKIEF